MDRKGRQLICDGIGYRILMPIVVNAQNDNFTLKGENVII
jgi:hypothetical protein